MFKDADVGETGVLSQSDILELVKVGPSLGNMISFLI